MCRWVAAAGRAKQLARQNTTISEDTMAQTAITSPTDVVDFLTSQHEQIKSLFAKTLSASGEAREKAFVDLRRLLAVHETKPGSV
jgi:hypothetical protein